MAIQPNIAGYTGSLTGTPVLINPQADRGFVADWIVVIPSGTGILTVTIGADTLPVPVGIILTIPGPAPQFTVNGTGVNYIVYAGTGTAPSYLNVATGATGGGAPTAAPYLLDGATVDTLLTNGVAVGALDHTLDVVRVVNSSAGASTPLKLVGSSAANPLQVGGGVAFPLRQITTSGEQTIAQLGAVWVDVSNPADPKGALVLALGASETLAMLIKLGEIDLPGDNTIQTSGKLILVGGTSADLKSTNQSAGVTALLGARSAFLTSGTVTVSLTETSNSLACSGVEIQHIADGAAADSAAACGQFLQGIQRFAAGENQHTIAVNAKFNAKACTASFCTIPGGPIDTAKPLAIVTDISAGTLTLSIIDTKTGALLVGGVGTTVDVAYISIAV